MGKVPVKALAFEIVRWSEAGFALYRRVKEPLPSRTMSDITVENDEPPVGQATIVYLGPAAPHWEIRPVFGERDVMDSFRDRVNARLLLLPPHDPQFRRNRERVNRDGERENIVVEWDLGYPEDEPES